MTHSDRRPWPTEPSPATVPLSPNMNSVEIDSSMLISTSGAPSTVKVIPVPACLSMQSV